MKYGRLKVGWPAVLVRQWRSNITQNEIRFLLHVQSSIVAETAGDIVGQKDIDMDVIAIGND